MSSQHKGARNITERVYVLINENLREQQEQCLILHRNGHSNEEIGQQLSMSRHQVYRRLNSAKKHEKLDPALSAQLEAQGIVDLAGLHSGWLMNKKANGSGSSLYFFLGPDGEKISFVDALIDALHEVPRSPLITQPDLSGAGNANWFMVADLHVGGDYGDGQLEADFNYCVDDMVSRLPKAQKAFLVELGDILDANDHKGVTPHSGNPCDVKRDSHLTNTQTAIRLLKRAIDRLAETHHEVEVHMIRGNHDPSAYIAVLLALEAHYQNVSHINIVVVEEDFRVILWGDCGLFPHHGDTTNWRSLKDVWADQFPDEWAQAKMHRLVATAHFHHDKKADMVGATGEHFRTLHRANSWARNKALFSRGSLTAITVHKTDGEIHRTSSNIKPVNMTNYTQIKKPVSLGREH